MIYRNFLCLAYDKSATKRNLPAAKAIQATWYTAEYRIPQQKFTNLSIETNLH